ncbi:MAG: LptF/LptG family permease [Candidatus Brocadiia bacterium]
MLSILHRYVLRELVRSFVLAFLALTAIMLLGALFKVLPIGLGLGDLARLMPYLIPYSLAWVIPAAMLTACVMTYGRLAAENELKAVCASGIPLRYMCYPALLVAVVLTALSIPLNDRVIPRCRVARDAVLWEALTRNPFAATMLGTSEIGDHKVYVQSVEDKTLHNVVVYERPEERKSEEAPADEEAEAAPVRVFRARKATYQMKKNEQDQPGIEIRLEDAEWTFIHPARSARSWLTATAEQATRWLSVEDPSEKPRRGRSETATPELLARAERQRQAAAKASPGSRAERRAKESLAETLTEIHKRSGLAFSTLALCLVGIPLGIWMRRESKLASFAIAVTVFLMLYAMLIGGEGLAREQKLPPRLALWAPDVLTGALGLGMLLHTFRR